MKPFLFYYQPGARGDFLGLVLQNSFKSLDATHYKNRMPQNNMAKLHDIKHVVTSNINLPTSFQSYDQMFDLCDERNIITIRILLSNKNSVLDAAYFHLKKNKLPGYSSISKDEVLSEPLLEDVLQLFAQYNDDEVNDLDYRHRYDYVVNFDDLFDIKKINSLYSSINGRAIDIDTESCIVQNMELQDRLSTKLRW